MILKNWPVRKEKVQHHYKLVIIKAIAACLLLMLLMPLGSFATTFYVSTKGNDNWSGTIAKANRTNTDGPFATVLAARNAIRKMKAQGPLQEAVEVLIEPGTYYLNAPLVFETVDAGSSSAPILYRSKGKAVFIGGIPIKNFMNENGRWKADLSGILQAGFNFEQLYINGFRATRARTPNKGFYTPQNVKETVIEKGTGRVATSAYQQVKLGGKNDNWLMAVTPEEKKDVVLTFYHKWDNTRKYISDINLDDTSLTIRGMGMKPWNPINDKSTYFVENYAAALDTAGEWFYDKKSRLLTYIPAANQELKNVQAYVPLLEQLVIIKGTKDATVANLSFQNLSFQVSGYKMSYPGQEPVQAAAPIEAAIMVDHADNILFSGCEIKNTGANAIWFRNNCSNSVIENSYLYDLGAGGIKIGATNIPDDATELTNNIVARNNIIQSGGHVFPCAAGVTIFNAAGNTVSHNDIADLRYSGISVGWIWGYKPSPSINNTIEYNNIHHLGWGELSDMGGIYTLGPSPGTVIRNNKVHHVFSYTYGGWGIYTDEGSSNILIENNLVYRTKSAGFHQHFGKENIIRNNIFALGNEAQLQVSRAEEHRSFSLTNNIIYFTRGELYKSHPKEHWLNADVRVDSNCFFAAGSAVVKYPGKTPVEWLQKQRDVKSIMGDPRFADAGKYDFRVKNKRIMQRIGFQPFDHREAGVYGSKQWKKRAQMPQHLIQAFSQLLDASHHDYTE
ncbi:right-handed parallel beta-helix repeat-containing protein [Aridibaculum aurantiacum]|uniref:right-handed parallel beta-helix repeat-containing protein n=1 Tax=Aridibaculum aurantiacum TaxID=2810307 RepID=UPI001A9736DD|nr:right-handed parallel beta-helix repeat-containing protein [Aridibaculum aurantiacum]